MRLLSDQNLSPRLVGVLADLYPDSLHVRTAELAAADDDTLWDYAGREGFTLVAKDADFHQRSFLVGYSPKVVWIRRGNCSTDDIVRLLRQHHAEALAFERDAQGAFLALG